VACEALLSYAKHADSALWILNFQHVAFRWPLVQHDIFSILDNEYRFVNWFYLFLFLQYNYILIQNFTHTSASVTDNYFVFSLLSIRFLNVSMLLGFHPVWNKELIVHISCPEMALVLFQICENRRNAVAAQYCLPFNAMRQGRFRLSFSGMKQSRCNVKIIIFFLLLNIKGEYIISRSEVWLLKYLSVLQWRAQCLMWTPSWPPQSGV